MNQQSHLMQYNKTTSLLVAIHAWRILGLVFLWGVSQRILDPTFGISAGVGDILAGVTAIPLAYFLRKGYTWSKNVLIIWSIFGIADLVNAIILGIVTNPEFGVSTMTILPWVLVPTVAVPIFLTLHGIILYRLKKHNYRHRNKLHTPSFLFF